MDESEEVRFYGGHPRHQARDSAGGGRVVQGEGVARSHGRHAKKATTGRKEYAVGMAAIVETCHRHVGGRFQDRSGRIGDFAIDGSQDV